eukprot:g41515.t1
MLTGEYTIFNSICDSSDTEAVHIQIQQDLDKIQTWAEEWQVTFTLHKCQAMGISSKGKSNHHPLMFNGITITEFPIVKTLEKGETSLHLAAEIKKDMVHFQQEDTQIVKLLMEYEADITATTKV